MAASDSRPIPLKNTAYRVTFPLLDADGDLVTGASSLDSEVSKDSGTFADCTNEATEIATASGMYYLDLTSTEMNADVVAVSVKSASAKTTPIVLYPQEADDIKVSVTHWMGTAAATPTVAGVPEVDLTHVGGATTNVAALATNVDAILTDTGTTLQAELDGIQADTEDIQSRLPAALVGGRIDATVDGTGMEAAAVAAIADGVWDEATSGHTTSGTFGEQVKTDIDDILTDTGTTLQAEVDGIQADTEDIQARLPAALVGGRIDATVDGTGMEAAAVAIIADGVWDEAASGHTTAGTFGQGAYILRANTAQAGAATTITLDASASATDDIYNFCLIVLTAGTGAGQARYITDYVGATKVATVATWATNPSSDSVFVILPGGQIPGATAPTAAEVADAVWDEAAAGHTAGGSFGEQCGTDIDAILTDTGTTLQAEVDGIQADTEDIQARLPAALVGGRIDATVDGTGMEAAAVAAIADGVWDEATAGHTTGGTFGEQVKTDIDDILTDTGTTLQAEVDGIQADTEDIQARLPAALVGGRIDATVDGTGMEAGAVAAIADGVWDEATAGHTTGGTFGEQVKTDIDDILTDTGTTLQAEVDGIQADTEDIQARLPAALVGGRIDANMSAINNSNAAAVRLALSAGQIIPGTVDTTAHSPTTTEFEADDITEATADHFNSRVVVWTSGAMVGQVTDVTDYSLVGGRGHFVMTATTEAPANNDTFILV